MIKPSVGDTVLMSSPMMFLTIDVLPLLSSPLELLLAGAAACISRISTYSIKILISLSFSRALRKIDNMMKKLPKRRRKMDEKEKQRACDKKEHKRVTCYVGTHFLIIFLLLRRERSRDEV